MDDEKTLPGGPAGIAKCLGVAGSIVGGLVLWLLILWPHDGAAADAAAGAWRLQGARDFESSARFGTDTVSRAGPLGFLVHDGAAHVEELHVARLCAQLILKTLAVVGILLVSFSIRPWPYRLAWLLLPMVLLVRVPAAVWPVSMVAWALACTGERGARRFTCMAAIVYMGVLASASLSGFLLAAPCVMALALSGTRRFSWLRLLVAPLLFAVVFVAAWVIPGQALRDLPAFFQSWWQVLLVAGDHLTLSEPGAIPKLTFVVGGLLFLALLVAAVFRPLRWRRTLGAGLIALAAFLALKPGLVLNDAGQSLLFFAVAAMLAALAPAAPDAGRIARGALHLTRAPALLSALVASLIYAADTGFGVREAPGVIEARVRQALEMARDPVQAREKLRDERAETARRYANTKIAALVGSSSVDAVGVAESTILFGGYDRRHRPVFRAGLALSPELSRRNADFLESDAAPEFVVAGLPLHGDLMPTLIDPRSLDVICHRYEPALIEPAHLVLRRRPDATKTPLPRTSGWTTVKFGDRVNLAQFPGQVQYVSIGFALTDLGLARRILYRDAPLFLVFELAGGREIRRRITMRAASSAFLVNPLITDVASLTAFLERKGMTRALALRVEVRDDHARFYEPELRVEVFRNDGISSWSRPRRAPQVTLPERVLSLMPADLEVARPVVNFDRVEKDGRTLLQAHPPSELRFRLEAGTWHLTGGFGIRSEAWTMGSTDGVDFLVMLAAEGAEPREVFRKRLQPGGHEADRKMQPLDLTLNLEKAETLLLLTGVGPAKDAEWDWAFWSGLKLVRR